MDFIEDPKTDKLVRLLLQGDRIERIMSFCAVGQAPLRAVVYDVEGFAEKNDIVVDGKLPNEWKQDVGRLIDIIFSWLCVQCGRGFTTNAQVFSLRSHFS